MDKKKINLKWFRLMTKEMSLERCQNFYRPYETIIENLLCQMNIIELSKLLMKETDIYLIELESEVLSRKLAIYIGPITISYLDFVFERFPISSIWRLAVEAKFDLIKIKAREKLEEEFSKYDNLEKEKRI